jgi:hypothetical protein
MSPPITTIMLYDLVQWPTLDSSIKTLAKHLGFKWRDTHPSGAASIQWVDEWVKTKDPKTWARILEYNEDDCRARAFCSTAYARWPHNPCTYVRMADRIIGGMKASTSTPMRTSFLRLRSFGTP